MLNTDKNDNPHKKIIGNFIVFSYKNNATDDFFLKIRTFLNYVGIPFLRSFTLRIEESANLNCQPQNSLQKCRCDDFFSIVREILVTGFGSQFPLRLHFPCSGQFNQLYGPNFLQNATKLRIGSQIL